MSKAATGPKRQGRFSLNADQRAEEREASLITVGGKEFHPRRLSFSVMARWQEVAPAADDDAEGMTTIQVFENMLTQICVLIADEDEAAPDMDFLKETLDFEMAGRILIDIQPRMDTEVDRAGNSQPVAA